MPTRELAMQIAKALQRYGLPFEARVVPIYGGQSIQEQLRALRRGVDVVVATPGRALDHIRRGTLDSNSVEVLVLDEADEMLDMGFAEELEAIPPSDARAAPDRPFLRDDGEAHPRDHEAASARARPRHDPARESTAAGKARRAFASRSRTSCSAA